MKSEKLRELHMNMIKDKVTTYSFKFRYDNKYGKNIVFDVVFIADGEIFELMFAAVGKNIGFVAKVEKGYRIKTYLEDQYQYLLEILGINGGGNTQFSPKEFFEVFCDSIPEYVREEFNENEQDFRKQNYKITDSDGQVFIGWSDNNKRNRNVRNLEKTREYFGFRIYMLCKKYNISSRWGGNANTI